MFTIQHLGEIDHFGRGGQRTVKRGEEPAMHSHLLLLSRKRASQQHVASIKQSN